MVKSVQYLLKKHHADLNKVIFSIYNLSWVGDGFCWTRESERQEAAGVSGPEAGSGAQGLVSPRWAGAFPFTPPTPLQVPQVSGKAPWPPPGQ